MLTVMLHMVLVFQATLFLWVWVWVWVLDISETSFLPKKVDIYLERMYKLTKMVNTGFSVKEIK